MLGYIILTTAVLGGSSVGVLSNKVGAAPSHLLVNAWRFQVLLVLFVCAAPLIYLYEKVYVKMARMKYCFEILKSRGIRLDPARSLEE